MTTRRRKASDTLQRTEDTEARGSSLLFLAGTRVGFRQEEGSTLVTMKRGEIEATTTATQTEDGTFEFDVPAALYPEPDTRYFVVCDTPVEARSFRVPERNKIMDLEEGRGLNELITEQRELQIAYWKTFKTTDSKESLTGLQKNLKESKAESLKTTPKNPDQLKKMMAELKGIDDLLATISVELDNLERSPEQVKAKTDETARKREALGDQIHIIYLECVHLLATERGDTEEAFDTWQDRATLADFAAAVEVLKAGNAASNSTEGPKPLSPEELRRISMKRAKLLN